MQSYDNFGRLIYETNTYYEDGKAVTVSTMYNPEQPGRPVAGQIISTRNSDGSVETRNIQGGKIRP